MLYLDNNATTQPLPEVVEAVTRAMSQSWANPSSVHRMGQEARQQVELARVSAAQLIGAREREIVFTSGGTEANNLALAGVLGPSPRTGVAAGSTTSANPETPGALPPRRTAAASDPRRVLITTRIEHAAIRQPAEALAGAGVELVHLPVNGDGLVAPAELQATLAPMLSDAGEAPLTALVSIQWANNETGAIQPIAELAAVVAQQRAAAAPGSVRLLLHIDATQAVGKIPVDVRQVPADLLTLSAHKFHGPKGVGALFVRSGVKLRPVMLGGPQERDRRGGTENTAGILGMGVAAEAAQRWLNENAVHDDAASPSPIAALSALRDRFERGVIEGLAPILAERRLPGVVINSANAPRLWNTTNLGFPRLEAEAILVGLSERGLCASAGAACSSGSLEPSPVLLAMSVPEPIAHGSVRFSLSRFTTPDEIDAAIPIVIEVVARLARTLPIG